MKPAFGQAIMAFIGAAVLGAIAAAIYWGPVPVGGLRRGTLAFAFALMAAMDSVVGLYFLVRR